MAETRVPVEVEIETDLMPGRILVAATMEALQAFGISCTVRDRVLSNHAPLEHAVRLDRELAAAIESERTNCLHVFVCLTSQSSDSGGSAGIRTILILGGSRRVPPAHLLLIDCDAQAVVPRETEEFVRHYLNVVARYKNISPPPDLTQDEVGYADLICRTISNAFLHAALQPFSTRLN